MNGKRGSRQFNPFSHPFARFGHFLAFRAISGVFPHFQLPTEKFTAIGTIRIKSFIARSNFDRIKTEVINYYIYFSTLNDYILFSFSTI
jgi:hypothetical protein